MSLVGLRDIISVVLLVAHLAGGQPGSPCLVASGRICNMEPSDECFGKELSGEVSLIGTGTTMWDVLKRPLSFANDSRVKVSCLRILLEEPATELVELPQNSLSMLLSPTFLRSRAGGALAALIMHNVEISMSCQLLTKWQHFLCGVQLPGKTLVEGNVISIISWTQGSVTLEHVNLTCDPNTAETPFTSVCSMVFVDEVSDIQRASSRLQDPYLPLVLVVSRALSFNESIWPENGLRITANVTLSATLGSNVTISFGLRTVLFTVDKNSSSAAFLSFRGCILVDLPLSYLPLTHPRRPFGVLSTALWPVYREEVAMGLYNSTLILTQEEFKFWSFWLTILKSPMLSVSTQGNWTYANDVELGPSGEDYIHLVRYLGRYTTLINVRYQVTNDKYMTQQRNNILQITNDERVPPTVVFQIRSSADLLSALMTTPSVASSQHGNYIILTGNVTMMDEDAWPTQGATIQVLTTITTWPSSRVAFDLRLLRGAFNILSAVPSSSIIIKNIVLLNLAAGHTEAGEERLTTGLWAFNFSTWRTSDQDRISLERAVMVVPREEVAYYINTTMDQKLADSWISSFEVESYDNVNHSWIKFTTLATSRFSAQSLNITDTVPNIFDAESIHNTTVTGGLKQTAQLDISTPDGKREVLMFTLVAITLPVAVGASLLTFMIIKRRRLSMLCRREGGQQRKMMQLKGSGYESGSDEEQLEGKLPRTKEPPSCCFPLALQFRKAKFVNPLYEEDDHGPPGIVLTGVLGPAALARSLVPVTPQVENILLTAPTIGTVLSLELDVVRTAQEPGPNGTTGWHPSSNVCSPGAHSLTPAPEELRQDQALCRATSSEKDTMAPQEGSRGGARPSCDDGGCNDGTYLSTTVAAVAEGAAMTCGAAAGASYGNCSTAFGGVGTTRHGSERASSAGTVRTGPHPTASEARQVMLVESRTVLEAGTGRHAAVLSTSREQAGLSNSPFVDMQQLDRLRRDIGDRHLEVQHSLGWGGCGVVYKGIWKGLQVAVKTILLQEDSKQSQQFLTEATISVSLQHANIVTTFLYELRSLDEVDAGRGSTGIQIQLNSSCETQPTGAERMNCWKLYIVQEYCELGTLKAAIDQGYFKGAGGGQPNLAFLLTIALDVALGLAHVHSKDVVHGDVTVSNVLLQTCPSRPQGCIAKLADFGLSVKFEAGQTQGYHLYGGTPHYMAPERVCGVLSMQSDIYSLGVCFWELYCGTPPWRRNAAGTHNHGYEHGTSSSVESSGGGHHHHGPRSGAFGDIALEDNGSESLRFPRGCPPGYSSLVFACMSRDPQTRPSVVAVISTLQRLHRRYC